MVALLTATAVSQQPGNQNKKVPAMSSDDLDAVSSAKPPSVVSSTDAPAGLTRYMPEGCGLSIALPSTPVVAEITLAGADRRFMAAIRQYMSTGNGVAIAVLFFRPRQASDAQPETFLQGFFEALAYRRVFSNPRYTLTGTSSTGASFRGSCDLKGVPLEIEGFVNMQGRDGWFVYAIHPMGQPAAVQPIKDVLASARFDGSPCSEQ
jgi:hypothetical protein